MGKPKAPKPADPKETGAAQTATNIGTAIAQQNLNNVNQVTPYGDLTYNQTGTYKYTDPLNGRVHDIPTYTATQTLNDEQQAILDKNNETSLNLATLGADQSGRLNNLLSRPVDTGGLPAAGDASAIRETNLERVGAGPQLQTELADTGPIERNIADAGQITRSYSTDFSQDRQRVEDALMQRLNPSLSQDRERLESRLAAQGIRIGSEAYQDAMEDFSRQSNDARLSAILGAGQEQSRMVGLEAARAGFENAAQAQAFGQNAATAEFNNKAQEQAFGQEAARAGFSNTATQQMHQNRTQGIAMDNQAQVQETNADIAKFNAANAGRNQALQELFAVRNQPLNEITALMSSSQVKDPTFITPDTAQMATTDFAGIQQNYDQLRQRQYEQQMAQSNSLFGGVLGFGAALLSDRRAKTDVEEVGKTKDGQKIYSYRYKAGGPVQIGLMAQEVEKKRPDAVTDVGGVKMVDYGIALGRASK